ncbi:MAG TPA: thiamine-binding protein [Gemmatimonadales bacterium]|nr:thiamine-binding protein [Gemmatimonadales bacterium]
MNVSARVAIYPLRQDRLTPAITAVGAALRAADLNPEIGPMSTIVTGEAAEVFSAPRRPSSSVERSFT